MGEQEIHRMIIYVSKMELGVKTKTYLIRITMERKMYDLRKGNQVQSQSVPLLSAATSPAAPEQVHVTALSVFYEGVNSPGGNHYPQLRNYSDGWNFCC